MQFQDIADEDEDTRIELIGRRVMQKREKVGFVTDSDPGKADRYIQKLQERFPGIRVIARGTGPVAGVVYVTVAPPVEA